MFIKEVVKPKETKGSEHRHSFSFLLNVTSMDNAAKGGTVILLLLTTQFHTKGPFQFSDDLLVRYSLPRFILLNDLGLLINQLHIQKKKKTLD